jgi:hypothetical protein
MTPLENQREGTHGRGGGRRAVLATAHRPPPQTSAVSLQTPALLIQTVLGLVPTRNRSRSSLLFFTSRLWCQPAPVSPDPPLILFLNRMAFRLQLFRHSSQSPCQIKRHGKIKRRPLMQHCIKIDCAAMLLNDQLGDRETEPVAAHLRLLAMV